MKNFIHKQLSKIYYKSKIELFEIQKDYRHRKYVIHFDDTKNTDEWQDEVYANAFKIFKKNNLKTVLDIGCGSAFKTLKYFSNFSITGVEVPKTLHYLRNEYPRYNWLEFDKIDVGTSYELVILSDVIEHIRCPDKFLLNIIKKINFSFLVISTPERDIVRGKNDFGPPINKCHFREWNKQEFERFLKRDLIIIEHYISNYSQGTQVAVCKKKMSYQ